ncbi:MAG: hypothetical protein IJF54_05295 [Clostridia bacterium]|nr:hypothetical protein [Clostridia bacterium]
MKRLLAILMAVIMIFALTACDESLSPPDTAQTTTQTQTETENLWEHLETEQHTTKQLTTKLQITKPTTKLTLKPTTIAPTQPEVPEDNSRVVYITPTGKRYHYRATCAGKNAIRTTLNKASVSYTPCKKCAS